MNRNQYIPAFLTIACTALALWMWRKSKEDKPATLIDYDMSTTTTLPRGYRNNNPLNIRFNKANNWKGKVLPNTDANNTFEQFVSMAYGYRAALSLLRTYIRKYGCNTIAKIIQKWAPPTENYTQSYINNVCKFVGDLGTTVTPDTTVKTTDKDLLCKMAFAMSLIENGNTAATRAAGLPNMETIKTGWSLL